MNLKRNSIAVTALVLSAAVFVTTALADTLIGSGYDNFKTSVKSTAAQMEKGLDSFTLEAMYMIKDNGTTLVEFSESYKVDNNKRATETNSTETYQNGKGSNNFYYNDDQVRITRDNEDANKYYVTEVVPDPESKGRALMLNPFNEEHYSDMEKIFDAAVGGLKDCVQVEEGASGGKVYTGSLTETQVPALINAIASFGFKQISTQGGNTQDFDIPRIKSDIFIKSVSGKAVEDENGRMNSVNGEITFSGVDEKGVSHDVTIEVLASLKDINATTVSKPNLEGKTIEKVSGRGNYLGSQYVGTYKNNIVIEKSGQFVKIGERVLTITHADDTTIGGSYADYYKAGYESYGEDQLNITFEMSMEDRNAQFSYVNAKGETEYGQINPSGNGKIYLNLHQEPVIVRPDGGTEIRSVKYDQDFDSEFVRVFED